MKSFISFILLYFLLLAALAVTAHYEITDDENLRVANQKSENTLSR